MSDMTMLRDTDGNYYEFAAKVLAEARTGDGSYELSEDAIAAARMPDDVSGYAIDPIPGVDIIVKKNPGGIMVPFTMMDTRAVRYGDTGDARPR